VLSLIPISDVNPTRRTPYVTIGLIAANVIMFFMTPGLGQTQESQLYFIQHAPAPCELVDRCTASVAIPDSTPEVLFAVLVAMFLHAGWFHIIGNLLFLWVFGNNIEDHLGHFKYLLFYLAGGFAAAGAHIFTHLDSVAPIVGASGAVAAVMGAYLVLHPQAKVNVLVPIIFIFTIIQMPAVIVLGVWFLYQFLIGTQELAGQGGVAWMAHVGGFAFGAIGIFLLGGRPLPPAYHNPYPSWR
jgi:Uncharacterized membrane protein (homolog of Drosophila rhomboid)